MCFQDLNTGEKKKQKKKKKNKLALCLGLQKEERKPEEVVKENNLDEIKVDGDDDAIDRAIFQSKLQEIDENRAATTSLGSEEAETTFVEIHLQANSQRQPSGKSVSFPQDLTSEKC